MNSSYWQRLFEKIRDIITALNGGAPAVNDDYKDVYSSFWLKLFTKLDEVIAAILQGGGGGGGGTGFVIDGNDKVLNLSADTPQKLSANVSLSYNSATGEMKLIGKNGEVISAIDLPLEQVLVGTAYNSTTHILTFTWNTDPQTSTDVDLTGLIDTYEAGNGLALTAGTFSIEIDGNSTPGVLFVSADGLKIDLSGYATKAHVETLIQIGETGLPPNPIPQGGIYIQYKEEL